MPVRQQVPMYGPQPQGLTSLINRSRGVEAESIRQKGQTKRHEMSLEEQQAQRAFLAEQQQDQRAQDVKLKYMDERFAKGMTEMRSSITASEKQLQREWLEGQIKGDRGWQEKLMDRVDRNRMRSYKMNAYLSLAKTLAAYGMVSRNKEFMMKMAVAKDRYAREGKAFKASVSAFSNAFDNAAQSHLGRGAALSGPGYGVAMWRNSLQPLLNAKSGFSTPHAWDDFAAKAQNNTLTNADVEDRTKGISQRLAVVKEQLAKWKELALNPAALSRNNGASPKQQAVVIEDIVRALSNEKAILTSVTVNPNIDEKYRNLIIRESEPRYDYKSLMADTNGDVARMRQMMEQLAAELKGMGVTLPQ